MGIKVLSEHRETEDAVLRELVEADYEEAVRQL